MALLIIVLLHSAIATATLVTPTFRLVEDLLKRDYDKDIRPVVSEKDAVEVTVIPNLFILLAMDQQQETITFSNEFIMLWKDPQLMWNGSEFGYLKEWVKIPEKSVWTPDVIFDQSMSINERLKREQRLIDLKNDGTLRMSNPSVIEYPCILRTETFPYDVQECDLALSSWNFDMSRLIVRTAIANLSTIADQFDGNSEWDLEGIWAEESNTTSGASNFSQIVYSVRLRRKPVYYVLVIQAPTFIIATLTIFGLFTPFNQHGERREKVTLGLNMFVAISMMLTLISDMMPKAARLPLLGNYILAEIFVCGAGCLVSILILNLHQRCYTRLIRPPAWVHRFVLFDCRKKNTVSQGTEELPTMRMKEAPEDSPAFDAIRETLLRAVAAVRKEIRFQEKSHQYRKTWFRVFDRVDLVCLIGFQLFNVIASVLFMR